MGFSSGVASQFGYKAESSFGTEATVDKFLDFLGGTEIPDIGDLGRKDGEGLYSQGAYMRASRSVLTTRSGTAKLEACVTGKNWGTMVRHMLGSAITTPTVIAGSAYKQVHQQGSTDGMSLTLQYGVPQVSDGTVKPFTLVGGKVPSWELSCERGDFLKAAVDFIGKDVLTLATSPAAGALVAATYATPQEGFTWNQVVTFKIGGTASTASSEVSVSGGTSVAAVVNGFSLKHTNGMNAEGYGTSATWSREPKAKRAETILSIDPEFNTQAEFYDVFRANTTIPVEIKFEGSTISGSDKFTVHIIASACKILNAKPTYNDDDLATHPVELKLYNDGTNNPLQVKLISSDSAAL
jgi:hypothetical protein